MALRLQEEGEFLTRSVSRQVELRSKKLTKKITEDVGKLKIIDQTSDSRLIEDIGGIGKQVTKTKTKAPPPLESIIRETSKSVVEKEIGKSIELKFPETAPIPKQPPQLDLPEDQIKTPEPPKEKIISDEDLEKVIEEQASDQAEQKGQQKQRPKVSKLIGALAKRPQGTRGGASRARLPKLDIRGSVTIARGKLQTPTPSPFPKVSPLVERETQDFFIDVMQGIKSSVIQKLDQKRLQKEEQKQIQKQVQKQDQKRLNRQIRGQIQLNLQTQRGLQSLRLKQIQALTTDFPRPPGKTINLPIIPFILPGVKGFIPKVKIKDLQPKFKNILTPDFTSKALGIGKTISMEQFQKLLKREFTGLELRPILRVK